MKELKRVYNGIIITIVILILSVCIYFIASKVIPNNKKIVDYVVSSDIDYNVSQKDSTNVLESGKTYVSSKVNNIMFKYNFKLSFNKNIDAMYKYDIKAIVISSIDDDAEENPDVYEYPETLKSVDYTNINSNSIDLSDELIINYDKYNTIANNYNRSVNLAIKSKLLVVSTINVKTNFGKEEVYKYYSNIPLEKNTFSISLNKTNTKGSIYSKDSNDVKSSINTVFIIVIFILCVSLIYQIYLINDYKKKHYLEFKYRKIMKDYENVVVPIRSIPKASDVMAIRVINFKSMIDIQHEMHMPILCYKGNEQIIYLIMNNKTAYVYFLNDNTEKI